MTRDLIDMAVFEELSDTMGPDFAAELVAAFLSDAGNMFADLNRAIAEQDADGYRRAAHSIKSNAQTFGATPLAEQARAMELSGTIDGDAVGALRAIFDDTAMVLKGLPDD